MVAEKIAKPGDVQELVTGKQTDTCLVCSFMNIRDSAMDIGQVYKWPCESYDPCDNWACNTVIVIRTALRHNDGPLPTTTIMNIKERLRINHENLLNQYHPNVEAVLDLQATLLRDILPSVQDEHDLSPDATEWAKKWLYDTCTYYPDLSGSRAYHTP